MQIYHFFGGVLFSTHRVVGSINFIIKGIQSQTVWRFIVICTLYVFYAGMLLSVLLTVQRIISVLYTGLDIINQYYNCNTVSITVTAPIVN